jgi:hypothetical protein
MSRLIPDDEIVAARVKAAGSSPGDLVH